VTPPGPLVGQVTHYFNKIQVCVVKVTRSPLKVGDRVRVMGKAGEFKQKVLSLQVESRDVSVAKKGQLVGLKVDRPPKIGGAVYILI